MTIRNRIRVLQVIPDLGLGGAERMLVNLAAGLSKDQYEVKVVSLFSAAGTAVEADLGVRGIQTIYLGKRSGFDSSMFRKIRDVVRGCAPDVVHTHRGALQYALPAIKCHSHCVGVHTVHTVARREVPRLSRVAHRVAFRRLGVHPVVLATAMADEFEEVYGMRPSDVIPNGIPCDRFATSPLARAEWRTRERVSDSDVLFVCAARLSSPKNIQCLLQAFARVAASMANAVLFLAGDGPLRAELESFAAAAGILDRVRFLGVRLDVPALLGASDVFVLSSTWEGSPLSIMEAMAAGLPVVSTAVGGVPEIVDARKSGLLVPPNDSIELAAAMVRLGCDAELRRTLACAAQQRARALYDVTVMAERYSDLYVRAINQRSRKPSA